MNVEQGLRGFGDQSEVLLVRPDARVFFAVDSVLVLALPTAVEDRTLFRVASVAASISAETRRRRIACCPAV